MLDEPTLDRSVVCATSTPSFLSTPTTLNRSAPWSRSTSASTSSLPKRTSWPAQQQAGLDDAGPIEFEHFIRRLFEAYGMKAWVTQASRDDGIDAVATNEDPMTGGLCIIQAKRTKNTVPAEAVRALAGVMHDKAAAKGILVTTAWFGRLAWTSPIGPAACSSSTAGGSKPCSRNTSVSAPSSGFRNFRSAGFRKTSGEERFVEPDAVRYLSGGPIHDAAPASPGYELRSEMGGGLHGVELQSGAGEVAVEKAGAILSGHWPWTDVITGGPRTMRTHAKPGLTTNSPVPTRRRPGPEQWNPAPTRDDTRVHGRPTTKRRKRNAPSTPSADRHELSR